MDLDIPRLFALQDRDNIFEAIIADLYRAVLRPGDLAVDGGANEGLHAFPLGPVDGHRDATTVAARWMAAA